MSPAKITRRHFLSGAAGVAAAAGLAACGSSSGSSGEPASSSAGTEAATTAAPTTAAAPSPGGAATSGSTAARPAGAPAYVPFTGVTPDIPAGDNGIPAGFYSYPATPPTFTSGVPGTGGDLSFMLEGGAIHVDESKNQWWKYLNGKLGVDMKLRVTSNSLYPQKFQVTVAGGLQDDFVQFVPVANTPQLLAKDFTDLTDYLSGDNIKKYPGLASIPTPTWQISTVNGRIWGVAQPRPPAGDVPVVRGDVLAKIGVKRSEVSLADGKDFLALCKEFTDIKTGQYAMGEEPNIYLLPAFLQMMGASNEWSEENGKFTSVNETDQMTDALEQLAQAWSAGYINPDSFINPSHGPWWTSGKTLIYFTSVFAWPNYANSNPEWDLGALLLPQWSGGGTAKKLLGVAGYADFVGIRKASAERVEELLRICDYLAAPFGTQEFLDVNYGVPGVTYKLENGKIVTQPEYANELFSALRYVGSQMYTGIYVPGQKAAVDEIHKYLSTILPAGVGNPTWGLYSETAVTKGAAADKAVLDAQSDIIQGRKKVSSWSAVVTTWRKSAGDAMRKEYEQAFAALH